MMSMSLLKEGPGFRYMLREGRFLATGWARGTRRDAEAEARAHLRDLERAEAARDTIPSPPPPPPCPECDGSGGGWDGNPDHPATDCEKCAGTGAAPCDGCGEPSAALDDGVPKCAECLDLCHHCGARPHTKTMPGTEETQFCDECLAELELPAEDFMVRPAVRTVSAWGKAS